MKKPIAIALAFTLALALAACGGQGDTDTLIVNETPAPPLSENPAPRSPRNSGSPGGPTTNSNVNSDPSPTQSRDMKPETYNSPESVDNIESAAKDSSNDSYVGCYVPESIFIDGVTIYLTHDEHNPDENNPDESRDYWWLVDDFIGYRFELTSDGHYFIYFGGEGWGEYVIERDRVVCIGYEDEINVLTDDGRLIMYDRWLTGDTYYDLTLMKVD